LRALTSFTCEKCIIEQAVELSLLGQETREAGAGLRPLLSTEPEDEIATIARGFENYISDTRTIPCVANAEVNKALRVAQTTRTSKIYRVVACQFLTSDPIIQCEYPF
jgi:hypothetical protein